MRRGESRDGALFEGQWLHVAGLWWGSAAALWVALFNHVYIWVHYLATERPDMRRIYGPSVGTGR